jgi:hypothetical protein
MPPALRMPLIDDAIAEPPCTSRLGAEERVPRPCLAARRCGLEEERERTAAQLGEGRHGRIRVEQDIAPHRHERASALLTAREREESLRGH